MRTKVWILRAVCLLNFVFATGVAMADAPLRPGDQIEMKLGGVPSTEISALSGKYTIDDEGTVNLPHIGRVKIAGLTPGAAESTIENVYKSRDIYTNPNVVITMHYNNREPSLLEFNQRILEEAQDPSNPILERLRFLCISVSGESQGFA